MTIFAFQFLLLFLPWALRRRLLILCLDYELHPTSYIGISLILSKGIKLDANARIGHLNYGRKLALVEIGASGSIGNLNWFTSGTGISAEKAGVMIIGRHSSITNRHYFDLQSFISIGNYSTVAGVGSLFLTHSVDVAANCQKAAGIRVGDYCFISAKVCILSGCSVASKSVVAAGAVVAKSLNSECMLYGGVPAKPIKPLDGGSGYFVRQIGFVD